MTDHNTTTIFNDIYDSTNKKVLSFITAKCSRTSDISDIFQDTYMEVFMVIEKRGVNYIDNPEAFVMKITKQKIYKYYTLLDKLKFFVSIHSTNEAGEEVNIAELETDSFSIEDKVSNHALVEDICKHLAIKSVEIQKIFHLFYYLEYTIPEIAKMLSMSESNVKHKLYRTLNELRNLYVKKDGMK